jgi:hypothetical protein
MEPVFLPRTSILSELGSRRTHDADNTVWCGTKFHDAAATNIVFADRCVTTQQIRQAASIRTHEFACCDADSCESGERRCRPVHPVPAHPCADGAYPPSRSAPHAPSAASPPASRRSRTASSRSPTTRRFNANATASRSPSPASRTADASSHATTAAPPPSSAPSPSPPSSSSGSGNES